MFLARRVAIGQVLQVFDSRHGRNVAAAQPLDVWCRGRARALALFRRERGGAVGGLWGWGREREGDSEVGGVCANMRPLSWCL